MKLKCLVHGNESQLETPTWIVGLDGKVTLKALKLLKVGPERIPAQFGISKSFFWFCFFSK